MEFLKNNPKWIRQPKQVQISEDKVVILTERGTDLWARTYYGFQNDNAPVFQVETTDIGSGLRTLPQGFLSPTRGTEGVVKT